MQTINQSETGKGVVASGPQAGSRNTVAAMFEFAKRKARYGRRDWLVWWNERGDMAAEPKSIEVIEKAVRDTGGNGHFYLLSRNRSHRIGPKVAAVMLSNARIGVID